MVQDSPSHWKQPKIQDKEGEWLLRYGKEMKWILQTPQLIALREFPGTGAWNSYEAGKNLWDEEMKLRFCGKVKIVFRTKYKRINWCEDREF